MTSLKNEVVVITGASSGIGKAAAVAFAKNGAKIVLAARRIEKLNELKNQISSYNKNCLCVKTDVTVENDVKNLFNETEKQFGGIDILLNNAGRGLKSKIVNISYESWLSVIHTNLTSVYLCSREAIIRMIQKNIKGHIITVSSIAGLYGTANYAGYCSSKHGVTGFQRSMKWEVRKHGIKVSTIHPGRIDTEFFDSYKKRPSRNQMLLPEDIASYIIAIASRSFFKKWEIKILNFLKRIYYLIMH